MIGKVAVVTGAGKGIGRETAMLFADEGFFVVICSRTQESIAKVEAEIRDRGGSSAAIACDVGNENQVREFVEEASLISGKIDVLVNNAGVAFKGTLENTDLERWNQTIGVNLTGVYLMTRYAHKFMEEGSHIFNIGSNASKIGFPGWSAYCASKFGLLGFTNSIREELRGNGIKVTAMLPGPTDTPLWDDIPGDWNRDNMMNPGSVADSILNIYRQPKYTLTEEIFIIPTAGSL